MDNGSANPLTEFFRCPPWFADSHQRVRLGEELASALALARTEDPVWKDGGSIWLSSSDLSQWADFLRLEQYEQASTDTTVGAIVVRELYYLIRPLLGVTVRRHVQRLALRGWDRRVFPRWPVDRSVDQLHEVFLASAMEQKCVQRVPFLWFWPKGYRSCVLLTHDVETKAGLQFCPTLMDMDDDAGIKSSFQLVPEQRYQVSQQEIEQIRGRGFEVNVHDLNHDGHLYSSHETFRRRIGTINDYGKKFGAQGFRAGALYRNQNWFESLDFQYEMSVPNVAHLDPQHGGCCTLFPYFVGNILELPVTAIQDYSLFHVLGTYSTELWQTQIQEIVANHGLVHVITHPDYVIEERARQTYRQLLAYIAKVRTEDRVWAAIPAQVNEWWRQRSKMKLVWQGDRWEVTGEGSERATIAYAHLTKNGITYDLGSDAA